MGSRFHMVKKTVATTHRTETSQIRADHRTVHDLSHRMKKNEKENKMQQFGAS